MLRSISRKTVQTAATKIPKKRSLHGTSPLATHQPNAPLDLEPSFRALLSDVDLSLLKHKNRNAASTSAASPRGPRELEVFPTDPAAMEDYLTAAELDAHDEELDSKEARKSPAALFGSRRIGAVVLPLDLQNSISRLIAGTDKSLLHSDARRLFASGAGDIESEWDTTYDTKYKSRQAALRHEARDGTAFASIALPSHYSAIRAVLDHVKQRLGRAWNVEHVVDWGAGTGSALWASLHSFQKSSPTTEDVNVGDESLLANTTVLAYLGIDKRDGLVSIGKKLLEDVDMGSASISWKKTYHGAEKPERTEGEVLAISAFMMSALPTPLARKALVKEMWESGAETIILIDHNTNAGFSNIAEAREFLLKQGRKDAEGPESSDEAGCHVLAPCPHDGACPIYFSGSTKVVCGFGQRLHRPDFLRKTKHTGVLHEDVGYSYVVIRRGPRPPRATTRVGRVGEVGRREEAKQLMANNPITELVIDGEHLAEHRLEDEDTAMSLALVSAKSRLSQEQLEVTLRAEAYSWPRLVFPPLKKSGHIILDGCNENGKIMRITIPKSQGKQPYYDARKSSWGDIFPHEPKNRSQVQFEVSKTMRSQSSLQTRNKKKDRGTVEARLNSEMEKEKGRLRKERKLARMERSGL